MFTRNSNCDRDGKKKHDRNVKQILLILPDKTRSQVATRILIDATIKLISHQPAIKVTILYGLGTHPLMTPTEIETLIGKERYSKLEKLEIAIKQQTTQVKTNELVEIVINSRSFQEGQTKPRETVKVPQLLFKHDLTFIAGDTKIHPYEGRYGSGGPNKMLAVGIASLNEIRRSHSTSVLLDRNTRVGDAKSPFVKLIDRTAEAIRQAMLSRPDSQAMSVPYGLTVLAQDENQIFDVAFGTHESYRKKLSQVNYLNHSFSVDTAFNLIVSDVDPRRGTDFLAGARALQYICDWNDETDPLLKSPEQGCVALLYNPCSDPSNSYGIGNEGTKEQLDILLEMTQELSGLISTNLSQATNRQEVEAILATARRNLLKQWQLHLQAISEADQVWLQLEALAQKALRYRDEDSDGNRSWEQALQMTLVKYSGNYNFTMRRVKELLAQYEQGQEIRVILDQIRFQLREQEENFGLGEGGQRALRLLKICQHFRYFLIATFNPVVISYIQQLTPDLRQYLSPALQDDCYLANLSLRLLGVQAIDLNTYSPQAAIDLACHYSACLQPSCDQIQIAYLEQPVMLQKTRSDSPDRDLN